MTLCACVEARFDGKFYIRTFTHRTANMWLPDLIPEPGSQSYRQEDSNAVESCCISPPPAASPTSVLVPAATGMCSDTVLATATCHHHRQASL